MMAAAGAIAIGAAAVVGGVIALVNYFGARRAEDAATVPLEAIPEPYSIPGVRLGGDSGWQTTSMAMDAETVAMTESELQEFAAEIQAYAAEVTGGGERQLWAGQNGQGGGTLTEEEIARFIDERYPPEVQERWVQYDTLQQELADGRAAVGPDGSLMVSSLQGYSEHFAQNLSDEGLDARVAAATDIASRTRDAEATIAQTYGRATPQLEQGQLDAYRSQYDAIQARLGELGGTADALGQQYGQFGIEDRAGGMSALGSYADQIAAQEASLQGVIAGTEPSVAVLERQRALEQTQRANMSMAASARDPNAWRSAMNANAGAGGQASYDAALLRAQEIATARGQLADVTGQRSALQDYYSQLYGTDVGAQAGYSQYAGDLAGTSAATAGARGQLELGVAAADTESAVASEANRDQFVDSTQTSADQYALDRQQQADAFYLGSQDAATNMLTTDAQLALERERIQAQSYNDYMALATGQAGDNANRNLGVINTETAGYLTALSSAAGTYSTFASGGAGGGGGGGGAETTSGRIASSKWGSG